MTRSLEWIGAACAVIGIGLIFLYCFYDYNQRRKRNNRQDP